MIRTVGHGTVSQGELSEILRGAGVATVVDVRRFPGSRRHPHFGRDRMAAWLADDGFGSGWIEGLGGRRRPDAASPNVGVRNLQLGPEGTSGRPPRDRCCSRNRLHLLPVQRAGWCGAARRAPLPPPP